MSFSSVHIDMKTVGNFFLCGSTLPIGFNHPDFGQNCDFKKAFDPSEKKFYNNDNRIMGPPNRFENQANKDQLAS